LQPKRNRFAFQIRLSTRKNGRDNFLPLLVRLRHIHVAGQAQALPLNRYAVRPQRLTFYGFPLSGLLTLLGKLKVDWPWKAGFLQPSS
jgi:hypothetical protein